MAVVLICLLEALGFAFAAGCTFSFSPWSFGSKGCEVFFGLRCDGAVPAVEACVQLLPVVVFCPPVCAIPSFWSTVSSIKGS